MELITLDMYFWLNEEKYPGSFTENQLVKITESEYNRVLCPTINEMYDLNFCEVDRNTGYIKVHFNSSQEYKENYEPMNDVGFDIEVRRHRMDKETVEELKKLGFDETVVPYNGEDCLLACSIIDGKLCYPDNRDFRYLPDDGLYTVLYSKTAKSLYEFIVKDLLYNRGSRLYREWLNDNWRSITPETFKWILKSIPLEIELKLWYNQACDSVLLFLQYGEELFYTDTDDVKEYLEANMNMTDSFNTVYRIGFLFLDSYWESVPVSLCIIRRRRRDAVTGIIIEEKIFEKEGRYKDFTEEIDNLLICDDRTWYLMDCYQRFSDENKLVASFVIDNDRNCWNVVYHPAIYDMKYSATNVHDLERYNPDMGLLKLKLPLKSGDIVTVDCRPFHDLHHAVVVKADHEKCEYLCLHYSENGLELKRLDDFYHGAEELSPLVRLDYYDGELKDSERLIGDVSEALRSGRVVADHIIREYGEYDMANAEERIMGLLVKG